MVKRRKNLAFYLALITYLLASSSCLLASPAAATAPPTPPAPPTLQSNPRLPDVELIRLPLGDFGYLEYDATLPAPDAGRFGGLIRLLFDSFPSIELPDRLVLHWLRFSDYEIVAVRTFGPEFRQAVVQDFECAILLGFNTRASLSDELAEVYAYQLYDELVVHEFLHHILHRLSPVPIKRYHPGDWSQTLLNNHKVLVETTQRFMGSPVYKRWLRENR